MIARTTTEQKRNANRKKLLGLLPRAKLDGLLDRELRPWHMNRPDLVETVLASWDADTSYEVRKAVEDLLEKAEVE